MDIQPYVEIFAGLGGITGIGLMVRWLYRRLTKTSQTEDLVDISLKLLQPAEDQIGRLSARLADAEARAEKLTGRIKELETESRARELEMDSLREQVTELRSQLLTAQLEVVRLQGMLNGQ